MVLIAKIKLRPSPQQKAELQSTLRCANEACNALSAHAYQEQNFRQFSIHKSCYYTIKEHFDLPSQLVIRCISKVADSYKKKKDKQRQFSPLSAMPYDSRILRFYPKEQSISIRTLNGRQKMSYVMGEQASALMEFRKGECALYTRKGKWYLQVSCEIQEAEMQDLKDVIGVDLGICQIATTSDGKSYSGAVIEKVRKKYQRRRTVLQKVGTPSAKRRLRKNSGKEKRFRKDVNHQVSKEIVMVAERTGRGIALEDLKGVRDRLRVRKADRAKFSGWSFSQLRQFIGYKAQRAGIPVHIVNPRYTSQCCNACLHIEKANRKSQSKFRCRRCGHEDNADVNAAKNIKLLGNNQVSYGSSVGFIRC